MRAPENCECFQFRSEDGRFAISLPPTAVRELLAFCEKAKDVETGGILIGRYTGDHVLAVVERVTGPPPDSQHLFARFRRGVQGLQELLNQVWSKQERQYYLGEWHFHPLPIAKPSGQDNSQMRGIAGNGAYNCPEPILLIVAGPLQAGWQMSATVHARGGSTPLLLDAPWNGESP